MRIVITKMAHDADREGPGLPTKANATPSPRARTSKHTRWAAWALIALLLGLAAWRAVGVWIVANYIAQNLALEGVWLSLTPSDDGGASVELSVKVELATPFPGYGTSRIRAIIVPFRCSPPLPPRSAASWLAASHL